MVWETPNELGKNENLCDNMHRLNKNKADYCIKSMLQQLVAVVISQIEKTSHENYAWTLLLLFTLWSVVLRLGDVSNKYFKYTEMGSMPRVAMALAMGDFLKK